MASWEQIKQPKTWLSRWTNIKYIGALLQMKELEYVSVNACAAADDVVRTREDEHHAPLYRFCMGPVLKSFFTSQYVDTIRSWITWENNHWQEGLFTENKALSLSEFFPLFSQYKYTFFLYLHVTDHINFQNKFS